MSKVITIAILGAGSRGLLSYAPYALKFPDKVKIVAVAEPRQWFREEAVRRHDILEENTFSDWKELLNGPKIADAVIIATQDSEHREPAILAAKKGYDILLEKPMATSERDCRAIVAAAKENSVILSVCHVLRYTPYFKKLREVVQSGVLGQVATVRHFEQVGFWHQAHSYVRGNWRRADIASPMILAKSCHDLDILQFLLGEKCTLVSSFGDLRHFRKENKPNNASDRCVDCAVQGCPYSASEFYMQKLKVGDTGWPLDVVTQEFTSEGLLQALREGPYGRCVYSSDNDVVDHQVLSMQFESGISATFTMTAFTVEESRRTEIFGSHGEVRGDGESIILKTFADNKSTTFDFSDFSQGADSGHMGGDFGIMDAFVESVYNREDSDSSAAVSLASHLLAFTAERSRINKTLEKVQY